MICLKSFRNRELTQSLRPPAAPSQDSAGSGTPDSGPRVSDLKGSERPWQLGPWEAGAASDPALCARQEGASMDISQLGAAPSTCRDPLSKGDFLCFGIGVLKCLQPFYCQALGGVLLIPLPAPGLEGTWGLTRPEYGGGRRKEGVTQGHPANLWPLTLPAPTPQVVLETSPAPLSPEIFIGNFPQLLRGQGVQEWCEGPRGSCDAVILNSQVAV